MDTISDKQIERDAQDMFRRLDEFLSELSFQEELEEAKEQSLKEGIEKGIEKGKLEAKLEIATKMKQMGYPLADILLLTDLTDQEVEEL